VPAVDPLSFGGIGLAAAGSAGLVLLVIVMIRALLAGKRRLMTLFSLARRDSSRGYHVLETDDIVAWCCGLLRPRIVVSRRLVSALSATQLDVVLAHENAHADRRDNLRALLLRWSTALWPVARRQVRLDLREDCERACDATALTVTGSREVFAGTLGVLSRFHGGGGPARGAAFGRENIEERLAALPAEGSGPAGAGGAWLALGGAWLTQVLLVTATSHFVVEWLGF
jgi:Zn-dependent protease with chaperone function